MQYLVINGVDFSQYVNALKVTYNEHYNAQTNAAGDTVVDYINTKKQLDVGFISMGSADLFTLLNSFRGLEVDIDYRDPVDDGLVSIKSILPTKSIEYYSIRVNNVMAKAFTLTFTEL